MYPSVNTHSQVPVKTITLTINPPNTTPPIQQTLNTKSFL